MNLSAVRAITLDLYGTLLDVESSLFQAFADFLAVQGHTADTRKVLRSWETAYFQETMIDTLLEQGRTPFEQISRSCLSQVLARFGLSHTTDVVDDLLASRSQGRLFPDVAPGLGQLKGKYTLVVLSNGDRAALEQTVANLELPVDRIVSAEQAGVYKPHPAVYRTALEDLKLEPAQVLHVAAHAWDIRGAVAFGMAGAFVNRPGLPYGDSPFPPTLEVPDLRELAARVT